MDDQVRPPKTIQEVGIHLVYMNNEIIRLAQALERNNDNFATKTALDALKQHIKENYVTKEEYNKLASKVTPIIVFCGIAASTIIAVTIGAVVTFILNGGFGAK